MGYSSQGKPKRARLEFRIANSVAAYGGTLPFIDIDKPKAELVKLRYFVGMTIEQAAEVLGISTATAKRHWAYARAWLHLEIRGQNVPNAR
jgi:hypothetical protein